MPFVFLKTIKIKANDIPLLLLKQCSEYLVNLNQLINHSKLLGMFPDNLKTDSTHP